VNDLAPPESQAAPQRPERGSETRAPGQRATATTVDTHGGAVGQSAGRGFAPPPGDDLGRLLAAAVVQRAADAQRLRVQRRPPYRSVARLVDQHRNTHLPGADELAKIDVEINPTAPKVKGVKAPEWDGAVGEKDHVKMRAALKAELTTALKNHLAGALPDLKKRAAAPKLAMTAFEGPGRAAKRVTDGRFGSYTAAAALTAPQVHARSTFSFTSGNQLLDRTNPKDFKPDAADVASWIAQTDSAAAKAQEAHHFNKDRSTAESVWLDKEVLAPFVGPNKADLELYDIYGFASSGAAILIAPTLTGSAKFPTAAPKGGGPSRAERYRRWKMWALLVHEYIHTLEHPAFEKARGANRILFEGFCEMFTEGVLRQWIPIARADGDGTLRGDVEGRDGKGNLWPGFDPDFVDDYDAGAYASYAKRAKNIRKVVWGGENAMRAAFFQGHIELIGLAPSGKIAAAPVGPAAPKGMRFHVVVASGKTVETADQIATQNGVTTSELLKANPGVDFTKLKAGANVLIPLGP
jgi:hypothetical protein